LNPLEAKAFIENQLSGVIESRKLINNPPGLLKNKSQNLLKKPGLQLKRAVSLFNVFI
jgi:hypothetical protein